MSHPCHALITLPERTDMRGSLTFAQQSDHIPFAVKRFFAIYGLTEGVSRGGHAHRLQHQFLIMLAGKTVVTVDNGATRTPVTLDRPNLALYAPPMLWLELEGFSKGAVCMVLVSDLYAEADYIRERDEFLRLSEAAR
jgi:dTDP-4-dehydrorhamnose 3,5-epimerase-like enzyme